MSAPVFRYPGLLTPLTPNFIRTSYGASVPIAHLNDVVLRGLAKKWTQDLIAKARKRRKASR